MIDSRTFAIPVRTDSTIVPSQEPVSPRLLNKDVILEIFERIKKHVPSTGQTSARVQAWWNGELRWARNRVSLASDRRGIFVDVTRRVRGATVAKGINQCDDASLIRMLHAIERDATFAPRRRLSTDMDMPDVELPYPKTAIWSDTTYNVTAAQRGVLARALTEGAEANGMLSAGYMEMHAYESMNISFGTDDLAEPYPATDSINLRFDHKSRDRKVEERSYWRYTQAQCSMTVRHPKGIGSGWAGASSFDWSTIDGKMLADRALQKCLRSLNPVSIEPGRYTVILEPQAVATLMTMLVGSLHREFPEEGRGPFALQRDESLGIWRTKLGQRVVDPRITIHQDPTDVAQGVRPFDGLKPITWIANGVLVNLSYDRGYATEKLTENFGEYFRSDEHGFWPSFVMDGGPTPTEEMIATTKRGVLITRFSDIAPLEGPSMLATGLTRDGLWLIENGKIVKSICNMRFTDSPLFVLNQLEQIGPAVPVFNPIDYGVAPIIVPTLKARDFAFTATIDAV